LRLVVGKAEKRVIRLLAERGGVYPSIIALTRDYVSRYGYGFYTRRWLRVFTRRLYRMQEKGLVKVVSEPGRRAKQVVLQPLGWAHFIRMLRGEVCEGKGE
jgi:DNA-binding beta-propeller fold protein YncE